MNKYKVTIERTSRALCEVDIEANNEAEATSIAINRFEGYEYVVTGHDYLITEVEANDDLGLLPEQLDDKYNQDGGGEHPVFSREEWRTHVAEQWTVSGYWDWVYNQINNDN